MAVSINEAKIKFSAEGAGKVASDTETVTKGLTRLGNESTAAGRNFSSQSKGLGGLVAAYAGAAATSFALQQAFAALQKAAQFDQVIQGTNTFSAQFGVSADTVISDIKRITQGQLSIVDSAKAANLALSAGFNTKQLNDLADIATKSSRALGRDLSDSFDRLVKGSSKLEPELLDELGIFTRIEPAVEKYAAKLNKSTAALSEFERRQAFVNSVIEEGQNKFSIIDTSSATASQSYAKLAANLTDLALTVGNVIANALAPLADYLNNNLSAAFGTFGLITSLVFSKAGELASENLKKITDGITAYSGKLSTNFAGSGKDATEVLKTLSEETSNFNNKLGKGLGDQKARRDELINFAKAGTITVNQVRELNGIVKEQIARDKESEASLRAKMSTLDKTSITYDNYNTQLKRTEDSLKQNEKQLLANNKVLVEQSNLANKAAVTTAFFGKAVGFLGSAVGKALSFVNLLLTIYSVINLIGPALSQLFGGINFFDSLLEKLGEVAKNILGLDKNTKALESGARGFASGVAEAALKAQDLKGNVEGLIKEKAFFGLYEVEVKINAEKVQKEVSDAILAGISEGEAARTRTKFVYSNPTEEQLNTADQRAYNNIIKERISLTESKLSNAVDENSLRLLKAQIDALKQVLNLGKEQLQIVGLISATTGISSKELFKYTTAAKDGSITMQTLGGSLQGQVYTLEQINKLKKDEKLGAQEVNNIQEKIVGLNYNLVEGADKLSKAQLDLNGIGKVRSDLLAAEESIEQQIQKLLESRIKVDDRRVLKLKEQLDTLKNQKSSFEEQATSQESVLRVQEAIRKTFSSQINALTNITGLTDSSGKLATTDLEVKRNQLSILQDTAAAADNLAAPYIAAGKSSAQITEKLKGTEKQIYITGLAAKQAIAGSMLESIKKATELTHEYEKQAIELDKQAKTTRLSIQKEELSLQSQINDKQKEYTLLVIQNELNAIQRQQRVNELAAERIDILRKGREDEAKSQMSGVLGSLFTDKNKRDIEIKFKEEELTDLKRALGAQVASAAATLEKEIELARTTKGFDDQKLEIEKQISQNDIANRTIDINSRIEEAKRQRELFDSQYKAIQEQITAFIQHPKELSKVLSQNILDQLEIAKRNNPDRADLYEKLGKTIQERQTELDTRIVNQVKDINDKLVNAATRVKDTQQDYATALQEQKTALGNTMEAQKRLTEMQNAINDKREIEAITAAQAKYDAVVEETGNKLEAAAQSLGILKREAERANNSFVILAVKTAEAITSNFEKSMNSLVDAIASGTLTLQSFRQGFKQFIVNILSDITKALVTETITKPFKEMVFGFTKDFLGVGGDIKNAATEQITKNLGENAGKTLESLKTMGATPVFIVGAAPGVFTGAGIGLPSAVSAGASEKAIASATQDGVSQAFTKNAATAIPGSTEAMLATIRKTESGSYAGDYLALSKTSSASGAYQYIDSTWQQQAKLAGVDISQYPRAYMAPPGIQDMVAKQNLENITQRYGAGAVPNVWYTGNAAGINPAVSPGQLAAYNQTWNANAAGIQVPQPPTMPADIMQQRALAGGLGADQQGLDPEALNSLNESVAATTDKMKGLTEGTTASIDAITAGTGATQALTTVTGAATGATQLSAAATGTDTVATQTSTLTEQADTLAVQTASTVITAEFIPAIQAASFALSTMSASGAAGGGGGDMAAKIVSLGIGGAYASGGMVGGTTGWSRFAGGGLKMRDSVPSLLEPGEFVMKKSSVDSIGRSAMERMNSTGRPSGGATNIKVQVENQGQPKEAEQGQTQFDGETAIVKLILKDLSSNGPIRRSIRGNM